MTLTHTHTHEGNDGGVRGGLSATTTYWPVKDIIQMDRIGVVAHSLLQHLA